MPRGYLKRSAKTVGRKASRGGGSRRGLSNRCKCTFCCPPRPPRGGFKTRLAKLNEDDLFDDGDLENFCRYHCTDSEDGMDGADCCSHNKAESCACGVNDFSMGYFLPESIKGNMQISIASSAWKEDDSYSFCKDSSEEESISPLIKATQLEEAARTDEDASYADIFKLDGEISIESLASKKDDGSYSFCKDTREEESTFLLIEAMDTVGLKEATRTGKNASYIEFDVPSDLESTITFSSIPSFSPPYFSVEAASRPKLTEQPKVALDENDESLCCAICLEEKPLIKLMRKCCHPAACFDCLRMLYIIKPGEGRVTKRTYPLHCFWPGCGRVLRDSQVGKLTQNQGELAQYYSRASIAKAIRKREMEQNFLATQRIRASQRQVLAFSMVHSCPNCGYDNTVRPYGDLDFTSDNCSESASHREKDYFDVKCKRCSQTFQVDKIPSTDILSVLDALGDGEDYSVCPGCGVLVVRNGGCDHISCYCGANFSYSKGSALRWSGEEWR